jgi:hypothetical protein
MPLDIRDHPDAPPLEELQNFTLVPVARETIESRLADGERLEEINLREAREDVYVELTPDPSQPGPADDIGTALYRLVQLFGTPQVPGFEAGADVSDREDTTFKYLFRLRATGDVEERTLPEEWLVTVFDWHVELGVGLATWSGDETSPEEYGDGVALVSLALATNVVSEPVTCEYEDTWY